MLKRGEIRLLDPLFRLLRSHAMLHGVIFTRNPSQQRRDQECQILDSWWGAQNEHIEAVEILNLISYFMAVDQFDTCSRKVC